jgi:YidC/Oxa1 family membrane protein insertase
MFDFFFYNPLYNALILIINHIPGGDIGLATIILTCLVKIILFPVSKNATKTQLKMKAFEPELAKIKEDYGNNREEFARKTLDFYKKNELNPFASFFLILIQLPIIFALAWIFYSGGLPKIDSTLLYSFVPSPSTIDTIFLGIIDVSKRSFVLSVLAGLAQFIQIQLSLPKLKPQDPNKQRTFSDDLAHSMNMQMKYVMPIFMFIVSFFGSGHCPFGAFLFSPTFCCPGVFAWPLA